MNDKKWNKELDDPMSAQFMEMKLELDSILESSGVGTTYCQEKNKRIETVDKFECESEVTGFASGSDSHLIVKFQITASRTGACPLARKKRDTRVDSDLLKKKISSGLNIDEDSIELARKLICLKKVLKKNFSSLIFPVFQFIDI